MMARLLECAVIFVLGTHLAKRKVFTVDRISTHWGAAKQLVVNGNDGNTLYRPHLLALPAPQGWAVGAEYGTTPPRTMLRAGTPSGPLRVQDDTYYNRSEACPVVEQMFPLAANGLVEATAGSTAWFRMKARAKYDAHHPKSGGNVTAFIVPIAPTSPGEERFEGYVGVVHENFDGTYDVSYEAEVAGTYVVQARIDGQRAQHYRENDKTPVDSAYQAFCGFDDPVLTVVHGDMDPARCSLLELIGPDELATPTPVGTATSVTVIARDSFGNTRTGGTTTSFAGHGDGSSDVFVVTLFNDEGHSIRTSSAVQVITAIAGGDVAVDGWFQLEFGGALSRRLSTSASAGEVQEALVRIFGDDETVNVLVSESKTPPGGVGVAWRTTFLSHLEKWSESPLSVVPAVGDGRTVVSIQKEASKGVYPIEYTLRYQGRYSMRITDARGEFIADGCRVVEATSVDPQPFLSTATSDDLYGGVAGEDFNTTVTAKISPPEPEPQTSMAPTLIHQTTPEHFDIRTSLEGPLDTVDLIYGGDDTLPTPFLRSIDGLNADHRDVPAQTYGGISAEGSSPQLMRPADSNVYGNCTVIGAERFRRRRHPSRHLPWAPAIRDRAIANNTTAVSKLSLADATLKMHSSNQHLTETDGWEVLARKRGWSARPVPREDHSAHRFDPSVHILLHGETVSEVQPVITDVLPERAEVVGEDIGTVVMSPLIQPTDEATDSAQVEPPEHGIMDGSGSDAASSFGRQSPDQISTRDGHVADPTDFVLPPYQSPAGLADPYGMTAPLPTEGRSRGELAARDGPETFPPRVSLILAPPEGQDHEAATSETRGSGQSVRSQSPALEAEEGTLQEEAGIRDATPGTAESSIGEAASSSGRQRPGWISTRDDTVADPAVLNLPPYQRPEGLPDPYGMTVPFSIGRWGPGELSTRNGPAPHPPAVSLPAHLDDQAQDHADTNGLGSDLLDRRQSSMSEGQHGETRTGLTNSATTPASEMSPPPRPPGEDEERAAGIVPPAALLRDPSERQNHEEAPTATVGSPTWYGSQPIVSEEEAEEGGDGADSRETTPGSLLSVFPGTQSHRQESSVPWAALLPPRCEAGVSMELLDAPSVEVSDGNDAAVASTMSASLARWALAVAALMTLMVVGVNRSVLRWAYVVRTFQAVVALLRDVGTTAQSFGAVVALRVKWMVGVVRSLVRNALTTARSFGAGVVERGMRAVEILRSLRALRYMFAGTRILGAAAFSAAAWVWEETSSECPLDRLWLALVVLWMAKRDILQCLLANLWNDIWSSSQERHECELRFLPKPEPATTFLHQLAWAVTLLAVYFGAMAAFVVYLEIIRPKWINWKEMQRACFEEVAAEAAKAAYRWMNLTPRTTHRRIACPPDQHGLVAAVRVLLSFPENRNLILAYKRDQDSSAAPSWWSKWSRRWKDRQVLLELAEVLRELWYYVDELEQDWFYEAADTALNDLGRLRDAMEKLLGTRALEKDGAELQLFLDVMRRTFPPEDVAFMNCGKSVASSCCNGSDSADHSAPLKIEGQLDIVSADMIWLEFIDNHLTRRSPLFRFLGQRATPRRSWTLWSRICKACRTITPRELLGLEPLRLERLPELLYIKMEGDGLRNHQLPDTVPFRAPDSDGLVYYAPAALLSSGGGGVGHIAAMRDVAAPNSRKWWSPDEFQQEVNSIESSPVFIVLRKDNARR